MDKDSDSDYSSRKRPEKNIMQELLNQAVKEKHEGKILAILNHRERAHESLKEFSKYPGIFGDEIQKIIRQPEYLLDLDYRYGDEGKTLTMIAA